MKRLLVLSVCVGLGSHAWAAATAEETEQALLGVQQTLDQSNAKVSEITAALADALKTEADLSDRLVVIGQNLKDQQAAIAASDEKISDLQTRAVILSSDLALRQNELSALLAGLMHLQSNPPPALVVEPGDVMQALRGASVFGDVVPDVRRRAEDLKAKLDEMKTLEAQTAAERQKRQDSITALAASQQELTLLQDQKRRFAEASQRDLAAEKANAASLAGKAKSLEQLLADLRKAKEEQDRRQSAAAKAAAEAAAKAEADRLALQHGPLKSLASLKGQLTYPVAGHVIKNFGEATSLGTTLDGLAIATTAQAIVNSPVDGKVEFAGPFRSYGQLLILDAGGGYLVLLAGMNRISADIGQTVRIGEPVGTMGDGPSTLALLGDAAGGHDPVFYVEFRKDNAPVDSTPWWGAGRKEAMK